MITGEYEDEKILRLRVSLMEGRYGPHKMMLSISADSELIFVELDGHRVRYRIDDLLADAYNLLVKKGVLKPQKDAGNSKDGRKNARRRLDEQGCSSRKTEEFLGVEEP